MKLKMTDDFRKLVRGIVIYMITAIVIFPVFHLVKGDFCWEDTLLYTGLQIVIALLFGVLFYFGSQIPEKKDN